jgi:hypothetical protein
VSIPLRYKSDDELWGVSQQEFHNLNFTSTNTPKLIITFVPVEDWHLCLQGRRENCTILKSPISRASKSIQKHAGQNK